MCAFNMGIYSMSNENQQLRGPVGFYEREFYPLSNFSSFMIEWEPTDDIFPTAEHLYHCEKFRFTSYTIWLKIKCAKSAHDAFKIAQENKDKQDPDWDAKKVDVMRDICRAKVEQHPYVKKKLIETGDCVLVEDSWRDDFWGWGLYGNGQNWLGKIWMEIRESLKKPCEKCEEFSMAESEAEVR